MGQSALGLLYGCEEPDIPHDPKDEEFFYDLVEEFNGAGADWRKPKLRVRCESEGGKSLVGVWVSVGGSGEDGVPYFAEEAVPIGQIETAYAKDIAKAKKLWDKFAAHMAQKYAVELPAATLWLTPCEVA